MKNMIRELSIFLATFGAIIFLFAVILTLNHDSLMVDSKQGFYQMVLHISDTLQGTPRKDSFGFPNGQMYIDLVWVISKVYLMSLLITMFITRFNKTKEKIEANERMEAII